ncbi:diguanylate cyclase [Jannaschia sp. 2305UL9-9]|uniref:diguanylate cyclase n=1 Tax=Jannaschia sp. 2305UL9-9 TaxID=3121638 RepID=UPI0035272566
MTGRILIVDDVATNRIVMKVKLTAAKYDVIPAASGQEALTLAQAGNIDIIIMDMMMPGLTGAQTCERLRADPVTASIPVILVTASDDSEARMEGLSAGADDFLAKPVDEIALLARVRSLLRTRDEERTYEEQGSALMGMEMGFGEAGQQPLSPRQQPVDGQIALIAGGDAAWLLRQRDRLRPLFREKVSIIGRDLALALDRSTTPDLFLIEADLGTKNAGLRLLSELKSRNATRHAAFIVILPAGDSERAATALDLGASDVAYQPFPVDEIAMRIRTQLARKTRADRMRDTLETGLRLAVIDPLTGLHNRRYGLHHLDRVATRCRAQGIRAGVILMDLDHFKSVNDTHGHLVGDEVLSKAAQVLKENVRGEDLICRIGGEEFLAVLPDSGLSEVRIVAERLRRAVENLEIRLGNGSLLNVTMSLGVAMLEDREDAPTHALAIVDRALYAAKDAGRNRVELAAQV